MTGLVPLAFGEASEGYESDKDQDDPNDVRARCEYEDCSDDDEEAAGAYACDFHDFSCGGWWLVVGGCLVVGIARVGPVPRATHLEP